MVGQREAVAPAQRVIGRQLPRGDAVARLRLQRHELHEVELARRAEQHAAAVGGAPVGRVRRPRRVAHRGVEGRGVCRLVLLPRRHRIRERELRERRAERRLDRGAQRRAVERRRDVGLVRVHRLALHELALDDEERCQLVVARLERAHGRHDAEQVRQEVFQVRREREQEVGLGLGRQRVGRRAPRRQPVGEPRIGGAQVLAEQRVDARQAVVRMQVGEREPVGESEGARHGRSDGLEVAPRARQSHPFYPLRHGRRPGRLDISLVAVGGKRAGDRFRGGRAAAFAARVAKAQLPLHAGSRGRHPPAPMARPRWAIIGSSDAPSPCALRTGARPRIPPGETHVRASHAARRHLRAVRRASGRRTAGQARRAQQLQGLSRVPRAVQAGHGARARRDQRERRRAGPQARDRVPRRQRNARRRGARGRGAHVAREGRDADGHVPVQRRPRGRRLREAAQGAVPRGRAADGQDRLGERQQVHVPAARVHVHADGDARARGRQARQEALGDRLSQLRVRPVGHGGVQEADERAAERRPRVHRAGGAARQDRPGSGRAGAARRAARRDLLVALRPGPRALRARGPAARTLQGPPGVQPAGRRARVPRSAEGRGARRLVRHRATRGTRSTRPSTGNSSPRTRRASTTTRGWDPSSATAR